MEPLPPPVLDRPEPAAEAPPPRGAGPPYGYQGSGWGPPPPPRRSPWTPLVVAVAVFVASVLGFGLAARLRAGSTAVQQPTGASGNPFPGLGSGASVRGGGATSSLATAVAAKVDPGVVDVNTTLGYQNGSAAGTGMILTSSGEVLTNNHVIEGATAIRVTVVGTGRSYAADVVGTDRTDDVAVLKLRGASGLKTVSIGDSSKLAVGDAVVGIGNALGVGGTPSAVDGTVEALDQTVTAGNANGGGEQLTGLIRTSAPLRPGDSGGPLVTTDGKVVGMDTAASAGFRFQAAAGVSFAIPINAALSIARQIEAGHASSTIHVGSTAFLGVQVQGSTAGGALVAGVEPGTPAAAAGLAAGDTIVSVEGTAVDSASALTRLLETHHPGDKVHVGWVGADGQSHSATVTLATGPAS